MSDSAVLRARLRNALMAERAFGVEALPIDPAILRKPRSQPKPRPPTPAATPTPAAAPAKPAPRAKPVAPATDLFGNPVKASTSAAETTYTPFTDPPLPRQKRIELLVKLDDDEVRGCTKCALSENRTHTVFGEGDPEANLMFVGEGPGENEDLSGRPFVGRAGQKLDEMIKAMGFGRADVYIANVVKCRPPGNRTPVAGEIAACTPYLHRQLELIRPKVIVTLGLPATKHILGVQQSMGKLRGRWHTFRGIDVMPTYHPAYLLRSYTPANRRAVWEDLQQVVERLGKSG
ncbi:MAG: uracil-DNA glycosylase [Planctomycetota bacterium]